MSVSPAPTPRVDWRDLARSLEAAGFNGDDRRGQSARVIEVGRAIAVVREAAAALLEPPHVDRGHVHRHPTGSPMYHDECDLTDRAAPLEPPAAAGWPAGSEQAQEAWAAAAPLEPPRPDLDRATLVHIVGKALYAWGDDEPNEATGFTARHESEKVADAIYARLASGGTAQPPLDPAAFEAMRIDRDWPTPMSMRSAADALDKLTIPRYGDVLRWMADACDGLGAASERPEQENNDGE